MSSEVLPLNIHPMKSSRRPEVASFIPPSLREEVSSRRPQEGCPEPVVIDDISEYSKACNCYLSAAAVANFLIISDAYNKMKTGRAILLTAFIVVLIVYTASFFISFEGYDLALKTFIYSILLVLIIIFGFFESYCDD